MRAPQESRPEFADTGRRSASKIPTRLRLLFESGWNGDVGLRHAGCHFHDLVGHCHDCRAARRRRCGCGVGVLLLPLRMRRPIRPPSAPPRPPRLVGGACAPDDCCSCCSFACAAACSALATTSSVATVRRSPIHVDAFLLEAIDGRLHHRIHRHQRCRLLSIEHGENIDLLRIAQIESGDFVHRGDLRVSQILLVITKPPLCSSVLPFSRTAIVITTSRASNPSISRLWPLSFTLKSISTCGSFASVSRGAGVRRGLRGLLRRCGRLLPRLLSWRRISANVVTL